ncbi:hypothetical protein HHI36_006319 [Cryptolaemus montrouzieri]|uniref:Sterol regulatory element-binding protein cleavage-activating protein n=1 Tax=Cryptolaemus montrouzieri TaxID=559131 RepID=A0ABD2NXR9_9CUCU
MSSRDEHPQGRGKSGRSTVPDKVAQFYYSYGLLASSWPFCILGIAITIATICCYPLINLPIPGNVPIQLHAANVTGNHEYQPFCYVQQLVLRVAVMPWESHLTLGDAFRAPLYESFKLLDAVRNYEEIKSSRSLGHVCLHVEAIKKIKAVYQHILPQYSCLVLSPANLWQQDVEQFIKDDSLLTTIFKHQNFQRGKTSVTEMLLGMRMMDTGIKRYPFRNRQRIIQYAVTLFFKEYDEIFIEGLRTKLTTLYPLHQNDSTSQVEKNLDRDIVLIQYPGEISYWEFVPITIAFVILFLYYYYSVRKIEVIKSKLAMSITVVVTVLGSMTMTLGICFFFGRTLSLKGKEIFPYLAMLVGTENVLVLTKSIVSTPSHLDVKIRIAQGLSKEGWGITKNLLLELTILTFGLSTFVHTIQEFCLFAITSLVTDFLLQMTFFTVILAIDIKRMEDMNEKMNPNFRSSLIQNQTFYDGYSLKTNKLNRSKSHPRLSTYPTNVVAGQAQGAQEKKIPKRLKLVNIWARTRFFQRSFMILMATWICIIAYNSGIVEHYILNYTMIQSDSELKDQDNSSSIFASYKSMRMFPLLDINKSYVAVNYVTHNPMKMELGNNYSADLCKLKHSDYKPSSKLSPFYWSSILEKYNLSLSRQYITLLPPIRLSHVISPEAAAAMRNPYEKYGETFQWQALAAALDPIEFAGDGSSGKTNPTDQPLFPSSPMEIFLTTLLCIVSVVVLLYALVVFYRCICSRNYAEWRASWFNTEKGEESEGELQVLLEAIPIVLEGHQQEVELMVTDGNIIVSCCLEGTIKIWDNNRGELISNIDRYGYFRGDHKYEVGYEPEEHTFSDYESGSPPSRDESFSTFPRLLHKINTNFSNIQSNSPQSTSTRYNFNDTFQQLYNSHKVGPSVRNRLKDINWLKDIVNNENRRSVILDSDSHSYSASGSIECVQRLDSNESAKLKCVFSEDSDGVGITHVKIVGSRVVAARLYGSLDFFMLQTYNQGRPIDWNFTVAYRRTHIRTGSYGSMPEHNNVNREGIKDELRCVKITSIKAHQQPITCLECEGGRVLTGSLDHTVKLSKMEDGRTLFTLHGHCGPIICMFIDAQKPSISGSGSQDGMLCIWDLSTGTCLYNIQAHNGSITSLTYSPSYIISLATDDKLCVWERFQGHLLTTIHITQTFSSPITMLAPHLVVTARTDSLAIWDVRSGNCVRTIQLGRSPYIFIKQLILLRDAVLCDYGNQMRVVRFPLITHKFD